MHIFGRLPPRHNESSNRHQGPCSCFFIKFVKRILQFHDCRAKWTTNVPEVIPALINQPVGFSDECVMPSILSAIEFISVWRSVSSLDILNFSVCITPGLHLPSNRTG